MPEKARATYLWILWIAAQQEQVATKEFAMPILCVPCGFAADNLNTRSLKGRTG
jgi:hypothetical protein